MKIRAFSYSLVILLLFAACNTNTYKVDLSGIDVEPVKIHRYGKALFEIDRNEVGKGLEKLSDEFSLFLGDNYRDTLAIIQISEFINDPFNRKLADACLHKFPELDWLEAEFTEAFRYYKFHFPDADIPSVYSYVSGLGYEISPAFSDSVLIFGLDLYLGEDFEDYRSVGLPYYVVRRMTPDAILPDCFKEIAASSYVPQNERATLLDRMIYHGKILFFLDNMLPEVPDEIKIGYTSGQLDWCFENQNRLWSFLVNNELFYSSAYHDINQMIQDGPFTSAFGKESPAMTGRWLGWQIVRKYAEENSGLSLKEILEITDSQYILQNSGYKPRRN
jgi:hypothetical protein